MSSPVSEICYLTLKPGVDIEGSTEEAKTWATVLKTIASQDGYQSQYWGRQIEHPEVVVLVIDWISLDKHKAFMASDAYGPMGASLTFTTNINFHHTTFSSHPPTLLGTAPVIEFATFYSVQDGFWENLSKFASAMEGDEAGAEGVEGYVKGQVMEEIKREGKEDNGRAVVLCVGWESVEKHMAFRGTEIFKENVGLLRVLNGGPDLSHVAFKAYV